MSQLTTNVSTDRIYAPTDRTNGRQLIEIKCQFTKKSTNTPLKYLAMKYCN